MTELGRTRSERIQMIIAFENIRKDQEQQVKIYLREGQIKLMIDAGIEAEYARRCANVLKWTLTEATKKKESTDQ